MQNPPAEIPVTNTSVNPARSTGPALFAGGEYIGQLWLFWAAPLIGAAIGGALARWMYEPVAITETEVIRGAAGGMNIGRWAIY